MKGSMDLNGLLETAGDDMNCADGSRSRIWENAVKLGKRRRSPLRWMIPAAAACTVLISLCAIPQARAAVLGFFGRLFDVMDYMNMDETARPENTAVAALIQDNVPVAVSIYESPGDGNEWVKNLKMHISEALCDRQCIVLKITIECPGINDFCIFRVSTDEKNIAENYKTCSIEGISVLSDNSSLHQLSYASTMVKVQDGVWTYTAKFNSGEFDFSGITKFNIPMRFSNIAETLDTNGQIKRDSSYAGRADLNFSLDATAGAKSSRTIGGLGEKHYLHGNGILTIINNDTLTNKIVSFDDCSLTVTSVVQTPVETRVAIQFSGPGNINLFGGLNMELLDGDKVVGSLTGGYGTDSIVVYDLIAPFLSSDVKTLTVRVRNQYYVECNGEKLQIGQPVTVNGECKMDEQEIIGGTFDIDLTK